jgi:ribosomal protein S11
MVIANSRYKNLEFEGSGPLTLSSKAIKNTIKVKNRFRLRKGLFVSYYMGPRRLFSRVQAFRKVEHFLVLRKTPNNVFISAMHRSGKLYFNCSAGRLKLRGPNRTTTEAAERIAESVCEKLAERDIAPIAIILKSPMSRLIKAAVRTIDTRYSSKVNPTVLSLIPRPHGSMRGRKPRRS